MASVLVQPVYIFALKIEAHKVNIFVKYYKVNLSFTIFKPILSNRNLFLETMQVTICGFVFL